MCSSSKPKPAPAPAQAPEAQDPGVVEARDSERLRRRAAASNTLYTGSQGAKSSLSSVVKGLLGQ